MSGKQLFLYGTNHRRASLEVREALALRGDQSAGLNEALRVELGVEERLILHTCNRTEVYGFGPSEVRAEGMRRLLAECQGVREELWEQAELWMSGEEVVRHVFEVAAGLDSQIVGETEIFGQLKKAYAEASERGAAGACLHRLMQRSFQAGKWARTHTEIGRGQVSGPTVAVELARRIFGDLVKSSILLVGSGEMAEAVLKVLKSEGAGRLMVTGRNRERVNALAQEMGADLIPYEGWQLRLADVDVVLTSTASTEPLLRAFDVRRCLMARRGRPLFLIDLAMPRDVEPEVRKLGNVYLYNLDDLAAVANENLAARQAEMDRCRQHLAVEAAKFWGQMTGRQAAGG